MRFGQMLRSSPWARALSTDRHLVEANTTAIARQARERGTFIVADRRRDDAPSPL
jgi:hypothetical protein